jgi:hypothetical protein
MLAQTANGILDHLRFGASDTLSRDHGFVMFHVASTMLRSQDENSQISPKVPQATHAEQKGDSESKSSTVFSRFQQVDLILSYEIDRETAKCQDAGEVSQQRT